VIAAVTEGGGGRGGADGEYGRRRLWETGYIWLGVYII